MNSLKIIDLAKASSARLFGNASATVSNIVIDSRQACDGCMFVCIIGDNNDGHKYAESAYENGCRVFLMSDAQAAADIMRHSDASVVLVKDTQEAFRRMAEWYLNSLNVIKIGVTGSVGKTTTKSLVAAVLAKKYKVVSSQKNYNTQLGLCMTTFLANPDTQMIVYEMGMDRAGEINGYCSWVKPNTAIITVVGDSHLERLGSKENIAKAKLEICNFLEKDDALIFNSDSPFLDMYSLSRLTRGNYIPIPVGSRTEASVRLFDVIDNGLSGISFKLQLKEKIMDITLPLLGKHNAINAALAACCGLLYDVPAEQIVDALAKVSGTDRRLAFEDINGLLLLDDSYNANPASMCAAIDVLSGIKANRHVAILADMYELGQDEISGHIIVGEKAAQCKVDLLIAIGKNAGLMAHAALSQSDKISVVKFENATDSIEKIISLISKGDAVLVKGSNATRVSEVARAIRELK